MRLNLTQMAANALKYAQDVAADLNHNYVGTEHILAGLLREREGLACQVLEDHGVSYDKVLRMISQLMGGNDAVMTEVKSYTPRSLKLLEIAKEEAARFKAAAIGTEHMLMAILKESDSVAFQILTTIGIEPRKVYKDIMLGIGIDAKEVKGKIEGLGGGDKKKQQMMVEQFSRDLTELARDGKLDPVVGRDKEIQRVIQILSRRTKNNPCLIGEPGVGKTAIAEALAQRIVAGNVPDTIKNKRVLTLDISGMVAGSKYRGEFEERIKKVIQEVTEDRNVLLFIDEIHTIIGAGGAEGALDAANIIQPSLARGEMQILGATTTTEYRKHIEKDAALERRFQPVVVEEPSEEEAVLILKGLRSAYEDHHHVSITDEALEAAVHLSARYINDRFLPDKAIDLVDEASSKVRLGICTTPQDVRELESEIARLEDEKIEAIKNEAYEMAGQIKIRQNSLREDLADIQNQSKVLYNKHDPIVDEGEIAEVVAQWTGIPVKKLEEEESERLRNLEAVLHERVVGQEEAVVAVSKAIRRGRVGLKDPKRPIGSFLFLGPTGVGKTELAKTLAEAMFGKEDAMIRVDMSEYMEKHSVSKLIGSPPGYVGYDEGGQLSEKIRRNPYSVLLFDEIEKAHPDVFNILLQVLDDGHITDSQGRKIDFKNTVIIMTSNAGATGIIAPKKLGFTMGDSKEADYQKMKDGVMEEIRKIFKPEFLNRIDATIVFHTLTKENVLDIADIMIRSICKQVKAQLDITLIFDEEVKHALVQKGFDANYGARPLRRVIQDLIEDQMAQQYLDGAIHNGETVRLKMEGDQIAFAVEAK